MFLSIGFGDGGDFLFLVAFAGEFEGKADNALAANTGEDRRLHRQFLGIATSVHPAASVGIFAFDVFADDDKIDVVRSLTHERTRRPRQQFGRPNAGVLLKAFANGQNKAI